MLLKSSCRNGFFVETFSNFLAKSEIDILRRYRRSLWKFATLHFRFFSIYSKFCISCWSIYKVDISVFVSVRAYFYDTAIPPYSVVINVFFKETFYFVCSAHLHWQFWFTQNGIQLTFYKTLITTVYKITQCIRYYTRPQFVGVPLVLRTTVAIYQKTEIYFVVINVNSKLMAIQLLLFH